MLKNQKYFLILLFLLVFSLGIFNICFALEVRLPGLPANPSPGDYVVAIIKLVTGAAGAIAVLAFVIGALGYMASAGNPEAMGNAASRMKSAILGVILLFSTYLILQTIGGEKLTTLEISEELIKERLLYGLYLTDGKSKIACPGVISVIEDEVPKGFTTIKAECELDRYFLLFKYDEIVWGGVPEVEEIRCGGTGSIAGKKSYVIKEKKPGVYLYEEGCGNRGERELKTSSIADLGPLKEKVKCVEVYNTADTSYNAILFSNPKPPGATTYFGRGKIIVTKEAITPGEYLSILIFQTRKGKDAELAGDGIEFFSNPNYNTEKAGGYFKIKKENNNIKTNVLITRAETVFNYDPGVPEEEKKVCESTDIQYPNFMECPGSIEILGDYLVILAARKGNEYYTEAFNKDSKTRNIKNTNPIAQKAVSGKLYGILIYALKSY